MPSRREKKREDKHICEAMAWVSQIKEAKPTLETLQDFVKIMNNKNSFVLNSANIIDSKIAVIFTMTFALLPIMLGLYTYDFVALSKDSVISIAVFIAMILASIAGIYCGFRGLTPKNYQTGYFTPPEIVKKTGNRTLYYEYVEGTDREYWKLRIARYAHIHNVHHNRIKGRYLTGTITCIIVQVTLITAASLT